METGLPVAVVQKGDDAEALGVGKTGTGFVVRERTPEFVEGQEAMTAPRRRPSPPDSRIASPSWNQRGQPPISG
jgi:hypothetical protein